MPPTSLKHPQCIHRLWPTMATSRVGSMLQILMKMIHCRCGAQASGGPLFRVVSGFMTNEA